MMKHLLPIFCASAMMAVSAAQSTPSASAQEVSKTPIIKGRLDGPREKIFETPNDSCSTNDVPDAMARAFRDYTGTVHFLSVSSVAYQSLGPNLDSLQHSCEPAFSSTNDGNPADYNDAVWLTSFYTFDGKTIAALSHTEYHGWSFAGECDTANISACEYDSDTYHQSNDGGYHFDSSQAPANLVAGVPYPYEIDHGPVGYSVDTNIVAYGGWYYAITTDDGNWPTNCSGQTGPDPCLLINGGAPIRTKNVFDPSSWRGWDGADFTVSFVDPYLGPVQYPEKHIYTPVPYMEVAGGLNLYQPANVMVATLWDYWNDELGEPGLFLTTSTDMVHWTKPAMVVNLKQIEAHDPPGSYLYAYFSLIDPTAPDPSFSIIGDHPYLYFVRLNLNSQGRVLFRQRISLTSNQ